MKTTGELYKQGDEDDDYYFSVGDYQPMLREFGEIILQVDDQDYQGDSRLIYKKDSQYGYLNFGWGSCSGCDALQACDSYEEIQDLMNRLHQSIQWFNSLEELQTYFAEKDWELEYSWHSDEMHQFIESVKNL